MAKIIPFRGILYNQEKIKNVEEVVAPPYDVISSEQQDSYYRKHENNIIRLILGKEYGSDSEKENRYTRAATYFADWQKSGVLSRDKQGSFYLYRQEYAIGGKRKIRDGLIALVKLEDFESGTILPHEGTFSSAKADRYQLMQSCQANFSPIFSLYSDPEKTIDGSWEQEVLEPPLIKINDNDEVTHKVWRISQPEIIKKIEKDMSKKTLFIADGHHRYETALNYRNFMRKKTPHYTGKESFNYLMMYFTNMDGEGATILPVNRLVNGVIDFNFEYFLKNIQEYFVIEKFEFRHANETESRRTFIDRLERETKGSSFGVYSRGGLCYYLFILKDKNKVEDILSSREEPVRNLDIVVLHDLIFKRIMKIKEEDEDKFIKYDAERERGLDLVKAGEYQIVFLVNETKIEQVKAVAEAGVKMPKKSTFFYPKLISGLVINKIVPEETNIDS